MAEQPKQEREGAPAPQRREVPGMHPDRSQGELGTHQGGKLSPARTGDGLHGHVPADLPPRLRKR